MNIIVGTMGSRITRKYQGALNSVLFVFFADHRPDDQGVVFWIRLIMLGSISPCFS